MAGAAHFSGINKSTRRLINGALAFLEAPRLVPSIFFFALGIIEDSPT